MLGTMKANRVFKDSRGWAVNTNPQTITILRKVLDIKVTTLTLLFRKITFFLRNDFIVRFWEKHFLFYMEKVFKENILFLKTLFLKTCIFLNEAFFENIFLCIGNHFWKKKILNTSLKKLFKIFVLLFLGFGSPLKTYFDLLFFKKKQVFCFQKPFSENNF